MKTELKEQVQAGLVGFVERQRQRDDARSFARVRSTVYRAKRRGWLEVFDQAIPFLRDTGLPVDVEEKYGVRIVHAADITLAYRPDGYLDRKMERGPVTSVQEPLFV
jgi:hypothetical protein